MNRDKALYFINVVGAICGVLNFAYLLFVAAPAVLTLEDAEPAIITDITPLVAPWQPSFDAGVEGPTSDR